MEYYLSIVNEELDGEVEKSVRAMFEEMSQEGKIDIVTNLAKKHLNNLSNRDYIKFDEKYIKLIYYVLMSSVKRYEIRSEYEVNIY